MKEIQGNVLIIIRKIDNSRTGYQYIFQLSWILLCLLCSEILIFDFLSMLVLNYKSLPHFVLKSYAFCFYINISTVSQVSNTWLTPSHFKVHRQWQLSTRGGLQHPKPSWAYICGSVSISTKAPDHYLGGSGGQKRSTRLLPYTGLKQWGEGG